MKDMKRGSAGGKKMAIIQKEQARQRIDEYNKHPNICLFCGKSILAPYDKKLYSTKIKKYCSLQCSTADTNKGKIRNPNGTFNKYVKQPIINSFSDEEIIDMFNQSLTISEFGRKMGYKNRLGYNNKPVNKKLIDLGLNIEKFKTKTEFTKDELFKSYSYQNANSIIRKEAREIYKKTSNPQKCIVCGYTYYEVAHIKSVSSFSDNTLISEINSENNLIALCPNHHWEYDNHKLDIQPYLDKI